MPGLLSIALADPKAVDAFLDKRADGDTATKRQMWAKMIAAGTAFIVASAALSQLGAGGGAEGVVGNAVSSLNVGYLAPITKALEDELDMLSDRRDALAENAGTLSAIANGARALHAADPAMIGTTLLGGMMKASKGVMGLFGKDKVAAEYEKYVAEMNVPVRVTEMMDSTRPEDRQALLLYWALATSAHNASDKVGTGTITGAELCNADSWTAAQCSSAKAAVLAAAKATGYSN